MNRIFLFAVLFVSFRVNAGNHIFADDSTGLEKKDGKVFILHQVESKETFYSISKRYKVTVDELKKYNPDAAAGLKIGVTLWVPSKAKMPAVTTATTQNTNTAKTTTASSGPKTHNVIAKETLFSISKKYNVSIEDLKKANPEIASGLKIGQVITIPGKGSKANEGDEAAVAVKKEERNSDNKKPSDDKKGEDKKAEEKKIKDEEEKRAKEEKKKAAELKEKEAALARENKKKEEVKPGDLQSIPVSTNTSVVGGYTKISETGIGEVIENNDTQKYLAFHKTAPIGTIIQVVNTSNNQKIFVKVIGPLPATAGPNVVIQMTAKAFDRLTSSSSDKQIKTEISYIKD
jgi:LysM repeat protein